MASLSLELFKQEARSRGKAAQQTKDKISIMTKKEYNQDREYDCKTGHFSAGGKKSQSKSTGVS